MTTHPTSFLFSGYILLRDPHLNKGLAFDEKERSKLCLQGLLPPQCVSQELQEKKIMHNLRQYQVPLQRYMAMMDLQVLLLLHFLNISLINLVKKIFIFPIFLFSGEK